jgi:hypothetical protein
MFSDKLLDNIPILALLCVAIFSVAVRRRQSKVPDPIKRTWMNFKVTTFGFGMMLAILWMALPATPSLSTFGQSKGLNDVTNPQVLMIYLRECTQAVVRTKEVVGLLIVLLILWVGSALYDFLKMLAQRPQSSPADSPSVDAARLHV